MKKFFSFALALLMVIGMITIPVSASTGTITVESSQGNTDCSIQGTMKSFLTNLIPTGYDFRIDYNDETGKFMVNVYKYGTTYLTGELTFDEENNIDTAKIQLKDADCVYEYNFDSITKKEFAEIYADIDSKLAQQKGVEVNP